MKSSHYSTFLCSATKQKSRQDSVKAFPWFTFSFGIQTSVVSSVEFVSNNGITPLKSWLGKFEFYNQNFMSLRLSNKWPILLDPHSLGIEAIQVESITQFLF